MVDGVREDEVPWSLEQVVCLIPSHRCPTLLSKAPMMRMQGFLSPPPLPASSQLFFPHLVKSVICY